VAYFFVAEAVTNVAKHAHATHAAVTIREDEARMWIVVADDGTGGATAAPGGGLAGLTDRLAAVDGTLSVSSPAGGPTRLEAVIPCGW
jgi:signal transduction histidine kinase